MTTEVANTPRKARTVGSRMKATTSPGTAKATNGQERAASNVARISSPTKWTGIRPVRARHRRGRSVYMPSTQTAARATRARVTSRSPQPWSGWIMLATVEKASRPNGSTSTVRSRYRSQLPVRSGEPDSAIAEPLLPAEQSGCGKASADRERRHHRQVQRVRPGSVPGVLHRLDAGPERGEVADAVHDVRHGLPRHPQAGAEHDREPQDGADAGGRPAAGRGRRDPHAAPLEGPRGRARGAA